MMEGDQNYSQLALAARNDSAQRKNKNRSKNSRRFSDEQIRSMESLFKLEAKLEPRKKLQMAGELGLQPRQVAIWFQNKRARWKSKQIEHEYRSLKADYDDLSSRFESLKKEKQTLITQYEKLNDQVINKPCEGSRGSKDSDGNSTDSGSENGVANSELKDNSYSLGGGILDRDIIAMMYSDDEEIRRIDRNTGGNLAQMEESEFNQADGFSEPCDQKLISGIDHQSDGLFDQLCGTSTNWWDFWT